MPDFAGLGGELALDGAEQAELARLRQSPRIEYASIRRLKDKWLRRGFDRFLKLEVSRGSPRAARFDAFVAAQSWWLDEYALFRSLHALHDELPWTEWPEPLARADAARVERRARLRSGSRSPIARTCSGSPPSSGPRRNGCRGRSRVFGDLPFMISADSPDVWARQHEFRFDATIGVPPDAFSETGQDWGLPPWRCRRDGGERLRLDARARAPLRRSLRRLSHRSPRRPVSHLRPADRQGACRRSSIPRDEPAQIALGETLDRHPRPAPTRGPTLIAEDLGSIPPFVRESMARLDLPGLKVLRWERHWDRDGQPPIDPREFPERSVATTGTHDIEPLAATPEGETEEQRAAVLQSLLSAGSCLTLIPLQDVFGWTDRINTPAVVDEMNWTWRVPWPRRHVARSRRDRGSAPTS